MSITNNYNNIEIKSHIKLPYNIIKIRKGSLYEGSIVDFKIRLYDIPNNQTEESIKFGGVVANFDMILETTNINANILVDTTVGNMYEFYRQLKNAYENLNGKAVLKNYGDSRCNLEVTFSQDGSCNIRGYINDKCLNGININIDIDQSYCYEWFDNFKTVFKELERIQGDDKFLY